MDRTPTAGISLLIGVDAGVGTDRPIRGASLEFLTGAEDPGAAYFGLSAQNVLLGSGDDADQILTRRGLRLTLAEVLTVSSGSMRGSNFVERDAWGATLSAGGALRLLSRLGVGDGLHDLGQRADLRYTYAAYSFWPNDTPFGHTVAHGLTLRVRP